MADRKWEKFERLVAAIHMAEQQGAVVKWNDTIDGRQFDVTMRFKFGLYEYLIVIECKDYKSPVPAEKVDALVTKSKDVNASLAVMVAASGFQSGAVEVARRHGVRLLTLKSLSDTPEGKIKDELMPVLLYYQFRFHRADGTGAIQLAEEPGVLRLALRTMKLEGPGMDTTPERVLQQYRGAAQQMMSNEPRSLNIEFPPGSVLIHPNTGERTPIKSFSFMFCVLAAKDLKRTGGFGDDPYLDGSVYKLRDEISKEETTIDASELQLGFDTILEVGKFYHNPHLKFSYYCEEVQGEKATMVALEARQHGRNFQAQFVTPKDWWWQFTEVEDEDEIERLKALLDDLEKWKARAKITVKISPADS